MSETSQATEVHYVVERPLGSLWIRMHNGTFSSMSQATVWQNDNPWMTNPPTRIVRETVTTTREVVA